MKSNKFVTTVAPYLIVSLISIVSVLSQIIDISVSITKAAGNHQQTLLNIALQFKKRVDNENRK
ncbi:MAG: hypothetical protein JRF06_03615 [Deltaproteobacteria bacterium]|nr:hypothetical protein [Deltaproteobacteria bacterium]